MKKYFLITVFLLFSTVIYSQSKEYEWFSNDNKQEETPKNEPFSEWNGEYTFSAIPSAPPPPPTPVPIDGGVGLLLAAGAGFGLRKLRGKKK